MKDIIRKADHFVVNSENRDALIQFIEELKYLTSKLEDKLKNTLYVFTSN